MPYFKMNMSDIHQNIKIENENIDERILETKFSLQGIENKIVYEEHRHDTDALIHGDGHISCTKDQDICMVERSTDFQRDRIVLKDTPNHVSVIACHSEALQPNESLYDDCHWIIDNTEKNDIEIKGNVSESFKQYHRHKKILRIKDTLDRHPVDILQLQQQAIGNGGLLTSELRCSAWQQLLGIDPDMISAMPNDDILKRHKDYEQVCMDVRRSAKRFPPGIDEDCLMSLQDNLINVIMRVLVRHPDLHYYQGFHDICVTLLLVVDEDVAFAIAEKLAISHLRDFMHSTMEPTQLFFTYLPLLIGRVNSELNDHICGSDVGNYYCISWVITWFGHVLGDIQLILRMFDFFIASKPMMPIYVSAAIVLYREQEILSTEQELSAMHQVLISSTENLPLELVLSRAVDLYNLVQPSELASEACQLFERQASRDPTTRRTAVKDNGKDKLPTVNSNTIIATMVIGVGIACLSVIIYKLQSN